MSPYRTLTPLLVALLTACAAPPPGPPGVLGTSDPSTSSSAPEAPVSPGSNTGVSTQTRIAAVLGRLPDCAEDVPQAVPADVDGLVLPPDSVPVDVTVDGGLTTVEAYVPLDPVEVRQFYELQNLGVLKTLMVEDEILEAEALVESRTHRMYVKAQAVCPDASTLYVVVAAGGSDARLPQPGDTDAPGAPPSADATP